MLSLKDLKLKRLLVATLVSATLIGTAYLLGWSSVLSVNSVAVEGTSSQLEIMRKLNADSIELSVGSKLARVEPRAIAKSVEMLDWIDQVKVSRNWLGRSVNISVVEKQAVAKSVSMKDGLINFDASGAIFKPVSIKQLSIQNQLPLVIIAEDEKSLLASVATLLSQLPPKSSELVVNLKSISVSSSGLIQMETSIRAQSLQINWGLARDIALKVRVLNALLKLPENKDISRVDLSQPELPLVS